MAEKESMFNKFLNVNVSKHTYQKPISRNLTLTYLQWAWAYSYMMEFDPNAKIEFKKFPEYDFQNGKLTGRKVDFMDTANGCYVTAIVTIKGKSRQQSLPVMNNKNQAMMHPDMMAINKAKQRCFVKCLALFGLGIKLYGMENTTNYKNGGGRSNKRPVSNNPHNSGNASVKQINYIKHLIYQGSEAAGLSYGEVAKRICEHFGIKSIDQGSIPYTKVNPIIKLLKNTSASQQQQSKTTTAATPFDAK